MFLLLLLAKNWQTAKDKLGLGSWGAWLRSAQHPLMSFKAISAALCSASTVPDSGGRIRPRRWSTRIIHWCSQEPVVISLSICCMHMYIYVYACTYTKCIDSPNQPRCWRLLDHNGGTYQPCFLLNLAGPAISYALRGTVESLHSLVIWGKKRPPYGSIAYIFAWEWIQWATGNDLYSGYPTWIYLTFFCTPINACPLLNHKLSSIPVVLFVRNSAWLNSQADDQLLKSIAFSFLQPLAIINYH